MNPIIDRRGIKLHEIRGGKFFTGKLFCQHKDGSLRSLFCEETTKYAVYSLFYTSTLDVIIQVLLSDCIIQFSLKENSILSSDDIVVLDYRPVNKIQYILE